jgi:hypothetical protein
MAEFQDLTTFSDMNTISEMDPSIADGYRVIYERETPLELRLQEVGLSSSLVFTRRGRRFYLEQQLPESPP